VQRLPLTLEESWVAPLPPPAALAHYEDVLPGSSERILRMAEMEVESKVENRRKVTDATIEQSRLGLAMASLLAIVCVIAAIVFFALQNDIAGGAMFGIPAVLLIRSFIGQLGSGRTKSGDSSDEGSEPL
jgi:uncharacterized membrane protein